MNKLIMSSAVAALLLSQAAIASEGSHITKLVNLSGPKMVKLVHSSATSSPLDYSMPARASTMCMPEGFEMVFGKGFPEGIVTMSFYIQNDTGAFEPIQSYDLLFKGGNAPAEPRRVAIDMSAYADYPTCTPNNAEDSVMEFSN